MVYTHSFLSYNESSDWNDVYGIYPHRGKKSCIIGQPFHIRNRSAVFIKKGSSRITSFHRTVGIVPLIDHSKREKGLFGKVKAFGQISRRGEYKKPENAVKNAVFVASLNGDIVI